MPWTIIPIAVLIIILCVVVKDYTDGQIKRAEDANLRERQKDTLIGLDDDEECGDIECETRDESIYSSGNTDETRRKRMMKKDAYRIMAELDTAIRIDTPNGGYKLYGIADKKVKSEYITVHLPFDNEKKIFSVQCSKDGDNFVNIEPCAILNSGKIYVGKDCMEFPLTLSKCVMLAHCIAKTNAQTLQGDTDFKYWRIGIDWECAGFDTWFSGDIDGKGILNPDLTPNDNFIAHFEL